MKRVIRSDKPVTLLLLLWSHKCDFGAEPRSRIIATSVVKGLKMYSRPSSDVKNRIPGLRCIGEYNHIKASKRV
jgi:hypothetical protein